VDLFESLSVLTGHTSHHGNIKEWSWRCRTNIKPRTFKMLTITRFVRNIKRYLSRIGHLEFGVLRGFNANNDLVFEALDASDIVVRHIRMRVDERVLRKQQHSKACVLAAHSSPPETCQFEKHAPVATRKQHVLTKTMRCSTKRRTICNERGAFREYSAAGENCLRNIL